MLGVIPFTTGRGLCYGGRLLIYFQDDSFTATCLLACITMECTTFLFTQQIVLPGLPAIAITLALFEIYSQ